MELLYFYIAVRTVRNAKIGGKPRTIIATQWKTFPARTAFPANKYRDNIHNTNNDYSRQKYKGRMSLKLTSHFKNNHDKKENNQANDNYNYRSLVDFCKSFWCHIFTRII